MNLIDKDTLVAEIEKVADEPAPSHDQQCPWEDGYYCGLYKVMTILDILEVKEVDLTEEIEKCLKQHNMLALGKKDFTNIAKHFFELGLQASSSLTWEDMMTIHKCCKDAMNYNLYAWETAEGQQKIYEEVLKRFKDFRERKEK